MGTWDWKAVRHEIIPLDQVPEAARLVAASITGPPDAKDLDRRVFEHTGLAPLSLIEWCVSSEVESIFKTLRDHGSEWGFVVEQGAPDLTESPPRKIALTAATAKKISDDSAMYLPMVFIDDQQTCMLVSYFSDYALICLREDLFETWLADNPIDLTLFYDAPPFPAADNLKAAREFADLRLVAWVDYIRRTRSP